MSGNRDYRNEPPSHQRLAARHAEANKKRSPEYSSARNNREYAPNQYPLEEYPQSRRVFTTDRDNLQDYRKEYNEKYPRLEGPSPNFNQRHSPKQRDIIDHRRQRPVSPRYSETQVREDRWKNDHRNIANPGHRLSPPYRDREKNHRYEEGRTSPNHNKGRGPNYKEERSMRPDYRPQNYAGTSNARERPERYTENNMKYEYNTSYDRRGTERVRSSVGHHDYEREHTQADRISSKQHPTQNEKYPKNRDRAISPNHSKEYYKHRPGSYKKSRSREPRPIRETSQPQSSRSIKEKGKDVEYENHKHVSIDHSREKSKSNSITSKKRQLNSRSRERSREGSHNSAKEDSAQKVKRRCTSIKEDERRETQHETNSESESYDDKKGEKSKMTTEPDQSPTDNKNFSPNESCSKDEKGVGGSSVIEKARALLNKSVETQGHMDNHNLKEEGDRYSEDWDTSKEAIEVQPAEIKQETSAVQSSTTTDNALTIDYIKQSPHQIIDTKFLQHLAEMHPVSALHELTHRLGWPGPNITLAFDCGPPFAKMYIFKAQVNGQVFQNTVAVNDVKIAKQNVAWLALQEMGFVKPDPANPV